MGVRERGWCDWEVEVEPRDCGRGGGLSISRPDEGCEKVRDVVSSEAPKRLGGSARSGRRNTERRAILPSTYRFPGQVTRPLREGSQFLPRTLCPLPATDLVSSNDYRTTHLLNHNRDLRLPFARPDFKSCGPRTYVEDWNYGWWTD